MGTKAHWDRVYEAKGPTGVSWYEPQLRTSLDLIARTEVAPDARIIDVGGGASTLVDDLVHGGYRDLTVLDVSGEALAFAKARLGARAGGVTWVEGDVTQAGLPWWAYDLWHDRAVFHFLTAAADRRAYVEVVRRALKPGGHVIIATFGPAGPSRCSGLPVVRYGPEGLAREFGEGFRLMEARPEEHRTPEGNVQQFTYARFQEVSGSFSVGSSGAIRTAPGV
ncbi:class I SAM-dependent methyltransferase [Planctomyces sp. SH-PL62]|uniref:class I SAM-dependent methyltransferase n=1 Tax=Planctomyces sp. SH-PL62 TaxID=1636152 RepID=UPI00078B71A4|nr:class I SAM-dependent methyltransferase [Planctomyces sp. SH-PL62]AMV40210.1 Methyltransferase domain protein [Planctomyces sp. SH-PL62]